MKRFDDFECPRTTCRSKTFSITRTGGKSMGRGTRFWHVYCSNPDCGIIYMDIPNDSGCVITALARKEPD